MAFEQVRMDRQLSRLELAFAVAIIAMCALWFFKRMNYLSAAAEATAVELTVRNIRTGAMGALALQLLKGEHESLAALHHGNPVGSVISAPAGYIGAIRNANPEGILPGQWYFDEDNGWLAYHVVNADYFAHEEGQPARLRVQLNLEFDDADNDGAFDAGSERPLGIAAVLLDAPDWKLQR